MQNLVVNRGVQCGRSEAARSDIGKAQLWWMLKQLNALKGLGECEGGWDI